MLYITLAPVADGFLDDASSVIDGAFDFTTISDISHAMAERALTALGSLERLLEHFF